ncbi:hypothetical protein LXL04_017889 [Taraxacum kok-saghyz]
MRMPFITRSLAFKLRTLQMGFCIVGLASCIGCVGSEQSVASLVIGIGGRLVVSFPVVVAASAGSACKPPSWPRIDTLPLRSEQSVARLVIGIGGRLVVSFPVVVAASAGSACKPPSWPRIGTLPLRFEAHCSIAPLLGSVSCSRSSKVLIQSIR